MNTANYPKDMLFHKSVFNPAPTCYSNFMQEMAQVIATTSTESLSLFGNTHPYIQANLSVMLEPDSWESARYSTAKRVGSAVVRSEFVGMMLIMNLELLAVHSSGYCYDTDTKVANLDVEYDLELRVKSLRERESESFLDGTTAGEILSRIEFADTVMPKTELIDALNERLNKMRAVAVSIHERVGSKMGDKLRLSSVCNEGERYYDYCYTA